MLLVHFSLVVFLSSFCFPRTGMLVTNIQLTHICRGSQCLSSLILVVVQRRKNLRQRTSWRTLLILLLLLLNNFFSFLPFLYLRMKTVEEDENLHANGYVFVFIACLLHFPSLSLSLPFPCFGERLKGPLEIKMSDSASQQQTKRRGREGTRVWKEQSRQVNDDESNGERRCNQGMNHSRSIYAMTVDEWNSTVRWTDERDRQTRGNFVVLWMMCPFIWSGRVKYRCSTEGMNERKENGHKKRKGEMIKVKDVWHSLLFLGR